MRAPLPSRSRSRSRTAIALVGLGGAAAILAACTAVLGFEDLVPLPSEAGPSGRDGAPSGEGGGGTPSTDAATDGPATCNADTSKDPAHCGRCFHDCVGGDCTAGVCQPVKLADGLGIPEGIAVSDQDVYVAEYDLNRILKFGKTSLSNCVAAPLPSSCVLTDDQSYVFKPTAMGIDTTSVYWANTGGGDFHEIRSCPIAGCGAQAATLVAGLGEDALGSLAGEVLPLALIAKDGVVFWPESLGGAIRSAQADGGALTTYLESSNFAPLAIAVDDQHVFFTDDSRQHPSRIQAVPRTGAARDGGAVGVIANTPSPPYGIGLTTSGNLYWTVPEDGLVQSAPKTADGGAPIGALASSLSDPHMLITDDANVYWVLTGGAEQATGTVVYCPVAGCPSSGPIVLAKGQAQPRHLAQDATAIYWSNEGLEIPGGSYDGQVWKIAKP
jgi:hypothetical protein